VTLFRVTKPTGLTPRHERKHRYCCAGAEHREQRVVEQPVIQSMLGGTGFYLRVSSNQIILLALRSFSVYQFK
jgi:hypothetical protein